jgi:hypothetical protein
MARVGFASDNFSETITLRLHLAICPNKDAAVEGRARGTVKYWAIFGAAVAASLLGHMARCRRFASTACLPSAACTVGMWAPAPRCSAGDSVGPWSQASGLG